MAESASAAGSHLAVDGARLRYRVDGQGPGVLLVHGWTLDLDMWEAQAAALARDFRVVRLDRRGFGLSSGRPSIAADVADVHALCRHLALERVALVGMSQGARVVARFAAAHAPMISCAVLDGPPRLDAAPAADEPSDLPYAHYRTLVRTQGLAAFRREWRRHPLARLRTEDPPTHALLDRMLARYTGRDLIAPAPASAAAAQGAPLESISCPVLLLNGEFDLPSRKDYAARIRARLAHAEFAEIPGAGHLSNLDNPRVYEQVLHGFLRRHALPSTDH